MQANVAPVAAIRDAVDGAISEFRQDARLMLIELEGVARASLEAHRALVLEQRQALRGSGAPSARGGRHPVPHTTPPAPPHLHGQDGRRDRFWKSLAGLVDEIKCGADAEGWNSEEWQSPRPVDRPAPAEGREGTKDAMGNVVEAAVQHSVSPQASTKPDIDLSAGTSFSNTPSRRRGSKEDEDRIASIVDNIAGVSASTNHDNNAMFFFVKSGYFMHFMNFIILLNSISIAYGINQELRGKDEPVWLDYGEHVFLGLYSAEFLCHCLAYGRKVFREPWIVFDFVLIAIGAFSLWILIPVLQYGNVDMQTQGYLVDMQQLQVMRLLRLVRLGKAARLASRFETIGRMVGMLTGSVTTMVSALLLLFFVLFMLACAAAEFIGMSSALRQHPDTGSLIDEKFYDLPTVIMTLFQFATMDGLTEVYEPIIKVRPWLTAYFLVVLVVVSFLLMNLITATVVEEAITQASRDVEMRTIRMRRTLKRLRPVIEAVFKILDTSGEGHVCLNEIKTGIGSVKYKIRIPEELQGVLSDRLIDLFEFIDADGSGMLNMQEFVDGVMHVALMNVPVETTQIIQLLRSNREKMDQMEQRLQTLAGERLLADADASMGVIEA